MVKKRTHLSKGLIRNVYTREAQSILYLYLFHINFISNQSSLHFHMSVNAIQRANGRFAKKIISIEISFIKKHNSMKR